MREVSNRPIFTDSFPNLDAFIPNVGSAYLYGASAIEERAAHSPQWEARARDVRFLPIVSQELWSFRIVVEGNALSVRSRSFKDLSSLWSQIQEQTIYLDFTGLNHPVWAPLLRTALAAGKNVKAVYVEPGEYRKSSIPTEGELFDLSERFLGIQPLPGFSSLARPGEDSVLVPLLGFEGTRLAYVVEQVQPPGEKIVPVIGVPGFRPEYPFYTYLGNRVPLSETRAWPQVRFTRANCPFSLYYTLTDIAQDWPRGTIKVAPIGTKPHALGAVLFYLLSARTVELVYDHPVRKAQRTQGASRVSVYHVSSLQLSGTKFSGSGHRSSE
jgi:hypothetical protein